MTGSLIYEKLATETSLRLIRVLPGLESGRIVCELSIHDLEIQPKFEYCALSYLWGDPEPVRDIFLQMPQKVLLPVRIHENLWRFLNRIQLHAASGRVHPQNGRNWSDLLIWTDFLSLNQADKEEISQQVPRMGHIYSHAAEVLIWLGDDESHRGALKSLCNCPDKKLFLNEKSDLSEPIWRIATMEYWDRVWVVQEVVLAKQALVMAGDVTMEFSALEKKLRSYDEAPSAAKRLNIRSRGAERLLQLRSMVAESKGRDVPLWRVIDIVHTSAYAPGCTKQADAVYGLLGLMGYQEVGKPSKIHITVDYGKSQVEVLFDTIFEVRAPVIHYGIQLALLLYGLGYLKLRWYEYEGPHTRIAYPGLGSTPARPLDLETYLKTKQIPGDQHYERHQDFARLALRVYNAAIIVAYTVGYRRWFRSANSLLSSGDADDSDQENLTPRQQAAVVGFALAAEASDQNQPDSDEPGYPAQQLRFSSPWRCASGLAMHEGVQVQKHPPSPTLTWKWKSVFGIGDRRHLGWICGEHGGSCDPREVSFEMAEIGLRLVLNIASEKNPRSGFWNPDGEGGEKVRMSMVFKSLTPVSTKCFKFLFKSIKSKVVIY